MLVDDAESQELVVLKLFVDIHGLQRMISSDLMNL